MNVPPGTTPRQVWEPALEDGVAALGLHLAPGALAQLKAFVPLLLRWNRVYNLTAIEDPREMVTRHLLDSLAVLPFLQGTRALDVGSGGGFPGIPLAVAQPERHFTLLDSREKKVRFLRQAVSELGLANVDVVAARVEQYRDVAPFDTLLARAFGSLGELVQAAAPLCRPGGVVVALKGTYPAEELSDSALAGYAIDVQRLRVPGLSAERHVVCLRI